MTTVLAVYNSEGCVGRCDAKCHEATSADCDCICGGRNHGRGFGQAVANTRELVDPTGELTRAFAQRHGLDPAELTSVAELPLFS